MLVMMMDGRDDGDGDGGYGDYGDVGCMVVRKGSVLQQKQYGVNK